jgi:hypothetical protein
MTDRTAAIAASDRPVSHGASCKPNVPVPRTASSTWANVLAARSSVSRQKTEVFIAGPYPLK